MPPFCLWANWSIYDSCGQWLLKTWLLPPPSSPLSLGEQILLGFIRIMAVGDLTLSLSILCHWSNGIWSYVTCVRLLLCLWPNWSIFDLSDLGERIFLELVRSMGVGGLTHVSSFFYVLDPTAARNMTHEPVVFSFHERTDLFTILLVNGCWRQNSCLRLLLLCHWGNRFF